MLQLTEGKGFLALFQMTGAVPWQIPETFTKYPPPYYYYNQYPCEITDIELFANVTIPYKNTIFGELETVLSKIDPKTLSNE